MDCKKVFDKIDELYEKYLDILEESCIIESPTDYKKGVDAVGEYFIKLAEEKGWEIEVSEQEKAGNAICITMNKESKNAPVSLSGHLDTVHRLGYFPTPVVKRDEVNMYGPGVHDCKGGVVSAFLAMDAAFECGFSDRPVKLILQSDEEVNSRLSNGKTVDFMCDKAKNSVAFLNCEGSEKGSVVTERKGILRYRVDVFGRAVHSAFCDTGANAVAEAAYKIIELEKMKDRAGITCNCGVINGGTAPNSVAAECSFLVDIRFSTNKELSEARENICKIVKTNYIDGCHSEMTETSLRPPMEKSDKNYELVEKINKVFKENNLSEIKARKALGGSDAAYTTQAGIPTVDSIGPEGGRGHSIDEFIIMESLKESAKRLACIFMSL